ncbi:MAG: IS3 family transposase [Actinomycetota bacterium]|nr:IS3 family transposase [Actinomycetota bacterium]
MQAVFDDSRGTYGWPRVHAALRREGVCTSRKRVARIMRQKALVGRCRRRWTKTTFSAPHTRAVDLLKRAFGPETVEVDRVYVGDITYIWTWEGWLYLATVIDPPPGGWWAGRWPTTCAPSWSPTPSRWPSPPVTRRRG